jgi:hypothetical protein
MQLFNDSNSYQFSSKISFPNILKLFLSLVVTGCISGVPLKWANYGRRVMAMLDPLYVTVKDSQSTIKQTDFLLIFL